jgi:hypothetical protein
VSYSSLRQASWVAFVPSEEAVILLLTMKPSIGSNCYWEDGSQIGEIRADCLLRGTDFDVTCFDPYRSDPRLLALAPNLRH